MSTLGLNRLKTILAENEIDGAILSEIVSSDELLMVDNRISLLKLRDGSSGFVNSKLSALVSH